MFAEHNFIVIVAYLPFAADRIIMPVLFLKSKPLDFEELYLSEGDAIVMLPEDILRLSQ